MKDAFKFNPFSGVFEEDLDDVLVPIFNFEKLLLKIKTKDSLAIEFSGKKGRGKTTHLIALQQKVPEFPIFLLENKVSVNSVLEDDSEVVFIDGIAHLSFSERHKLFKEKKVVIYTTHFSKKIECMLAKKKLHTIYFKGISIEILENIVKNRLKVAEREKGSYERVFTQREISLLIKKFGDDYRGIINHLYEKFQWKSQH
ncbi:hypothetical protein [Tenacibaculum maritimum]|uniref:hypothetical protein n=1 Tax=Tenacibaculum maritimum TaxID=107401 RepID=UPI0012E64D37|nr:hypothetical protein [Tenacibaculum maritimum]MCD9584926.1 hypothetical protein [Tenacibaculum maritimum]MCD9620660.1 hypothetical protein [Tenacibaculum maritimum]MCD9625963.1 hypothetical protein [Tenacibaculum maritimum]MCD9629639.1 hypothetical protein [Tenacibaculum maritimum]MCD9632739.1 hypothetical protein [Tenacibaculum maritimum]